MNAELQEITHCIRHLQGEFEDLCVGGLQCVGVERLPRLESLRDELTAIGAAHLSQNLDNLIAALRANDKSAAAALLRAQASLRVFERLLTLEAVSVEFAHSLKNRSKADHER